MAEVIVSDSVAQDLTAKILEFFKTSMTENLKYLSG